MIDFSKLNITTITKTVWKILQLLTYIFNELKKNIFWILMFNNYWDFNFWKTILRNRNHMMKEIIFKDFNQFDLTIDRISNWWGWRRWRKRRGFGGKETAPEPHHFYLGPAPGAGGGVPAHPLSGLYAPGTDRGESGPHGGQSTGTYRKTYLLSKTGNLIFSSSFR